MRKPEFALLRTEENVKAFAAFMLASSLSWMTAERRLVSGTLKNGNSVFVIVED